MNNLKKKNLIKLPSNIKCFIQSDKKILVLKNNQKNILIKKYYGSIFLTDDNSLLIEQSKKMLTKEKKLADRLLESISGFINNNNTIYYKKIILVGVGYRFVSENKKSNILKLILGYSHSIFIKLPFEINIFYLKPSIIYLTSENFIKLNIISNFIKKFKAPEPYKGKGIRFEYDNIILKEGKKNLIG